MAKKKIKKARREGDAEDKKEDKKLAKKHGMSTKAWEKSSFDKKHDKGYIKNPTAF